MPLPFLATLAASVLPSMIGSKQLGGMAPPTGMGAPSPGVGGMGSGGLLGAAGMQTPSPFQGAFSALDQMQSAEADPVTSKPSVFNTEEQNAAMQPSISSDGQQQPGGFANFLGGIDKGLQSPSQLLGLGLLSQLGGNSNLLPIGGLLGMGLLNRNK